MRRAFRYWRMVEAGEETIDRRSTLVAFAAAALVWLSARGLLGRGVIMIVASLFAMSGLAVMVAFAHASAPIAGAVTLGVAVVVSLSGSRTWPSRVWGAALRGRSFP